MPSTRRSEMEGVGNPRMPQVMMAKKMAKFQALIPHDLQKTDALSSLVIMVYVVTYHTELCYCLGAFPVRVQFIRMRSLRGFYERGAAHYKVTTKWEKKFKVPVHSDKYASHLFLFESTNDAINNNCSLHYAYFVYAVWGFRGVTRAGLRRGEDA